MCENADNDYGWEHQEESPQQEDETPNPSTVAEEDEAFSLGAD